MIRKDSNLIPSCEGYNFTAKQMVSTVDLMKFFQSIEYYGCPNCATVKEVSN